MIDSFFSTLSGATASDIWIWGLGSLPITALIAGCIWGFSRVFRHPAFWHAAWLLLCVKLLVPIAWNLPLPSVPEIRFDSTRISRGDNWSSAGRNPAISLRQNTDIGTAETAGGSSQNDATRRRLAEDSMHHRRPFSSLSLAAILLSLWGVGTAVLFASFLLRLFRLRQVLCKHSVRADVETYQAFDKVASKMGCRRRVEIRFGKVSLPPMLSSIGYSTKLYLPIELWADLDHTQRDLVLAHEIAHLRRRDDQTRWVVALTCILFWWNPIVWLACRELRQLEEHASDAAVAMQNASHLRNYAKALMHTIEFLSCDTSPAKANRPSLSRVLTPAVTMADERSFQHLSRRLALLSKPANLKWRPIHLLAISLFFVVPTGTAANKRRDGGITASEQRTG
ncbi:M56 family metallopeptidase [Stieleria sp. JC731]|uniref:M56 family metallopeptidase n=1 Tax=Pirellulaceae TaxID=2691357 RepID=UPI001E500AD2|nr:M56 family metallopeptidase [Stieleria sp. JC731]MCC9603127.1 M56 family metallopeptidase [Stieleria sp. JC731]